MGRLLVRSLSDAIIIQVPVEYNSTLASSERFRPLELYEGQVLYFGFTVGLKLSIDERNHSVDYPVGRIEAANGYWLLSNFSPVTTCVVESLENRSEFVKVSPTRRAAPIPFELARVVIPANRGFLGFNVLAPAPPQVKGCEIVTRLVGQQFGLDEGTKYFLVLVALCEPRLRDASLLAGVPTIDDVVTRLRRLPSCRDLTRTAVNYHLRYLTTKLPVGALGGPSSAHRVSGKREALVSVALRYDLVRPEHLKLLPYASATHDRPAFGTPADRYKAECR